MRPIKTILVATDFSEASDHALEYAVDLARRLDAQVVILHAYELPVYGFPDGSIIATPEMATRIAHAAELGLKSVAEKWAKNGVPILKLLRVGPPAEQVNAVAEEVGADLVVLGTHGRRGLSRALLGSVTEHVIRTATRPVLAVRTKS
jgi:nucleotide-binding universal stress UspA family protein